MLPRREQFPSESPQPLEPLLDPHPAEIRSAVRNQGLPPGSLRRWLRHPMQVSKPDAVREPLLSSHARAATTTPAPFHSPWPGRANRSPQRGAPVLHKISCTLRTPEDASRHRRPANSLRSPAHQPICPDTLRNSSQLPRQLLPREKQPRFHRAHRNTQHARNLFQRVSLNRCQQQHQSKFLRQLLHRPLQPLLELARHCQLFHRWSHRTPLRSFPLRLALLPPLRRAPAIQRHPERNPYQPPAKPRRLPQPAKIPVRLQQRLLRHILRVGGIPQNAIRHAKRQWTALSQPLFKLAVRAAAFALPLRRPHEHSSRLGQDQLPHPQSPLHQTRRHNPHFGSISATLFGTAIPGYGRAPRRTATKYSTSPITYPDSSHPLPTAPRAPPPPSAEPRPRQTPETIASSPPHILRCSSARARSPAPMLPAPLASQKSATQN